MLEWLDSKKIIISYLRHFQSVFFICPFAMASVHVQLTNYRDYALMTLLFNHYNLLVAF